MGAKYVLDIFLSKQTAASTPLAEHSPEEQHFAACDDSLFSVLFIFSFTQSTVRQLERDWLCLCELSTIMFLFYNIINLHSSGTTRKCFIVTLTKVPKCDDYGHATNMKVAPHIFFF